MERYFSEIIIILSASQVNDQRIVVPIFKGYALT